MRHRLKCQLLQINKLKNLFLSCNLKYLTLLELRPRLRSAKFLITELCFFATSAGKNKALRKRLEPIFDNLGFPLIDDPENLWDGVKPA